MSKPIEKVVLDNAIAIISEYGWHQGSYGTEEDGFCIIGSISEATDRVLGRSWYKDAKGMKLFSRCVQAVKKSIPIGLDVPEWNDDFRRKEHEVTDLLKKLSK